MHLSVIKRLEESSINLIYNAKKPLLAFIFVIVIFAEFFGKIMRANSTLW